jgi:hypothetical protein
LIKQVAFEGIKLAKLVNLCLKSVTSFVTTATNNCYFNKRMQCCVAAALWMLDAASDQQ